MSDLGLKNFLKQENINFFETNVGEKYLYESIIKKNLILGGEQSGHIILKNLSNTGDGIINSFFLQKI